MTDLRQQVNWIIRQIQCIREKGCLCFGYPTDLSYEPKGNKLTAKFVDGSTREATIPIPGKLSELENDLGILDPGSVKYEAEATATHAVGTLTVGTSTYPVKETVTVLSYDAATRKLTFVDEAGQTRELTLNIPTKTSQLTNDGSGAGNAYLTRAEVVVEPALADGHKIATVTVDGQAQEVMETITTLELDKPNKKLVFKSNAGTKDILLSDLASSGAGQTVTHTHQLTNDGEGTGSKFLLEDQVRAVKEFGALGMDRRDVGKVVVGSNTTSFSETVTRFSAVSTNFVEGKRVIRYTNENGVDFDVDVSILDTNRISYSSNLKSNPNKHIIGKFQRGGYEDEAHETVTTIRYLENGSKIVYTDEKGELTTFSIPVPKKTSELVNDGDGSGKKFITASDVNNQWNGSNNTSGEINRAGNVGIVAYRDFDASGVKRPVDDTPYANTMTVYGKGQQSGVMIATTDVADLVMTTSNWKRHVELSLYKDTIDSKGTFCQFTGCNYKRSPLPIFSVRNPGGIVPAGKELLGFKVDARLLLNTDSTERPYGEWWHEYRSGFDNAKQITPDDAAKMLRSSEVLILKEDVVYRVNAFTMMLVMAQAMTAVKTS